MTPEIISGNEGEILLDAIVGYGEAKCVDIGKSIGTKGLYSCLGLILMDNERIALAHIPAVNEFCVFQKSNGHLISKEKTHEQLISELFAIFGPTDVDTIKAVIVGGTRENSGHRVKKIKKYLKDMGIIKVDKGEYNTVGIEQDVYVVGGEIMTIKRKRPFPYGETSY
jgi:chemotaxis receptor (MCP) glutamine deamidase CheD